MSRSLRVSLDDMKMHHPQLAARLPSIPDSLLLFLWASTAVLNIWGRKVLNDDPFDAVIGTGLNPKVYPIPLLPPAIAEYKVPVRKAEFVVMGSWE